MSSKSGGFHYAFLIAIACCVLLFGPGAITFSAAGIFFAPVSKALGVGVGTFATYLTVVSVSMALVLPVMGKIIGTKDTRIVLTISVLLVAGVYMAMSRFTSVYMFYGAAVLLGVAHSNIMVLMVPTLINLWFKEKAGLFLGLCFAFTGVGGVVFNPVGNYLIQNYGWSTAYFILGVIMLVISLPFTLFVVRRTPAEKGLKRYGEEATPLTGATAAAAVQAMPGADVSRAVKSIPFYTIMIMGCCLGFACYQMFYFPAYAVSVGFTAAVGATAASFGMFGNMSGKIILGMIYDKTVVGGLGFGVISGIIGLAIIAIFNQSSVILYVGALLFGFLYATVLTAPPMFTRNAYGLKNYSQIYSLIATVTSLVGAFGIATWGVIAQVTGTFYIGFVASIVLISIALVLGVITARTSKGLY